MSADGLAALRARVHADPELALQLRRLDAQRFAAEVCEMAAVAGWAVDEADLAAAIDEARKAWSLRWIR